MTRSIVERWIGRNAVSVGMLPRVVPHGSSPLELGCGSGRQAIGSATPGFRAAGIDVDLPIMRQAAANPRAAAPECGASFQVGDQFDRVAVAPFGTIQAITRGGIMAGPETAGRIRETCGA